MKYFRVSEFSCHDEGRTRYPELHIETLYAFVDNVLDPIRERVGKPIVIVSGYRTREHNRKVGGAPKSRHCIRMVRGVPVGGDAADIALAPHAGRPADDGAGEIYAAIRDMLAEGRLHSLGGLGLYKRWVHVDMRPRKKNGSLYRWKGTGVGSEV